MQGRHFWQAHETKAIDYVWMHASAERTQLPKEARHVRPAAGLPLLPGQGQSLSAREAGPCATGHTCQRGRSHRVQLHYLAVVRMLSMNVSKDTDIKYPLTI